MNRILLPTDFSDCAEQAAWHALFLARQQGSTLLVLHVLAELSPEPVLSQEVHEQLEADAYQQLTRIYNASEVEGVQVELDIVKSEAPAPAILAYAEAHDVNLIVMGTHGRRGLKRLFLGSVAEEVVREASCPVLAVRQCEEPFSAQPLQRLLVPLDLSVRSQQALAHAKQLAASYDAQVDLLHVVEDIALPGVYGAIPNPVPEITPGFEERIRQEMIWHWESTEGPAAEAAFHIVNGDAASAIIDFADEHDADLIVLTSHGRTGLDRFVLGSISEKVMRNAPYPVYIVKSFASKPDREQPA